MANFSKFPLLPSLKRTLNAQGLVTATEVQERIIPLLLAGKAAIGVAQTGTGKTLAYVLPVLDRLKKRENEGLGVTQDSRPSAAILVPTRELGEQVTRVFKLFTHDTRLRVRSVLGGTSLGVAKRNVSGPFDVLVATPGRLLQLMERKQVSLEAVRFLVFDEADQMLDATFVADAKRIAEVCSDDLQLALFSATISMKVQTLIESLFGKAEIVRAKNSGRLVSSLTTKRVFIQDGIRFPFLKKELARPCKGSTLIFVNTREQCDVVVQGLKEMGRPCVAYRGEMDKKERRSNLKAFREEKVNLLVSTDLASRGLDVPHVSRIVNYHLPQTLENYVHRVGRTARAGRSGVVVNFVTKRDEPLMETIAMKNR
jgi:superfamily II DNA/RNA helicase